jgi:hypothetical protein
MGIWGIIAVHVLSVLHKAVNSILSVYEYGIQDREWTLLNIFIATIRKIDWKQEKKNKKD